MVWQPDTLLGPIDVGAETHLPVMPLCSDDNPDKVTLREPEDSHCPILCRGPEKFKSDDIEPDIEGEGRESHEHFKNVDLSRIKAPQEYKTLCA